MTCEEARDELIAYTRGELTEERTAAIEEHLARCAGCTRELEGAREVIALTRSADEPSTAELATDLIRTAVRRRATDIHIEAVRLIGRVRYRIDGVIHSGQEIPREQYSPLVAHIKRMAQMNVTERRVPQDGRVALDYQGNLLDLRVSTVPYLYGEGVVMRLVDRSTATLGLEELGLAARARGRVEAMIARAGGLLLTTGPTGAGKSTFLYSILNQMNRSEAKVVTVEDPVKLDLPGVNQLAVHRRAGVTHATGMRALLRQDPDVLMVSNLPDMETVELCVQAAQTGHLVLSVLHTRDTPEALVRLLDVGIAPFLLAGALTGVVGQRLVRRICNACREAYSPSAETLAKLGYAPDTRPATFTHGTGCDACSDSGYRGRIGLFEILEMSDSLARGIIERAPEATLRDRALAEGTLTPFLTDARAKIADGITTVEEVARQLLGVVPAGR